MQIRLENQVEFNAFYGVLESYYDKLCKFNTKMMLTAKSPYYDLWVSSLKAKDQPQVAEILANLVADHLLQRFFAKYYLQYYNEGEYKQPPEALRLEAEKDFINLLQISGQKAKLQKTLQDFFSLDANLLDTKGFRDFRLGHLKPVVKRALFNGAAAIDEREEYGHLVVSLQSFIKNQKPITNTLNIILFDGGSFALRDEQGYIIREQEILQELELAKELGCGYDDSLVSAVVSLAPKQIIIHQPEGEPIKISPLINDLLPDTIAYCQGCRFCNKQSQNL